MSANDEVLMVRIYCNESEHKLDAILKLLHDEERVAGVTAFRGIAGFGDSGKLHSSSLVDLSLELPVVLEFFDTPERVEMILEHLSDDLPVGHVVSWDVEVNN